MPPTPAPLCDATLARLATLARDVIEAGESGDGLRQSAAIDAFDHAAAPDTVLALAEELQRARAAGFQG